MLTLTELSLHDETFLLPFAVLVEGDGACHWAIATNAVSTPGWPEHVLKSKGRRASESWVLRSWEQWLTDVTNEPPEERHKLIEKLSMSTPGIVARKPRKVVTRLPARVVADQWSRRRLHDRAESIAARIASRLAVGGRAHWSSSLRIEDTPGISGDWVVERHPRTGRHEFLQSKRQAVRNHNDFGLMPSPNLVSTAVDGIAIIRVISVEQTEQVVAEWKTNKGMLNIRYPYGIAVVQNHRGIMVTDAGCVVGDRFAAPESIAVAATRAAWTGAFPLEPLNYDDDI